MQNTTEILKIDTAVTETKFIKKDIHIPYYFKKGDNSLCKVISSEHFLIVDNSQGWWSVSCRPNKHYLSDIANGTPITADEYNAAFDNAKMNVELLNDDSAPSNEPDDNVQIDEMIERRLV
jgi:hypothetical protein